MKATVLLAAIVWMAPRWAHANPAAPWQSPSWARVIADMGPIDFDGLPRIAYRIGDLDGIGIPVDVSLAARTDVDRNDEPESGWIFTGLMSWLAPEGRTKFAALVPDGIKVRFDSSKVGPSWSPDVSGNWRIRRTGPSRHEIASPDGFLYTFISGRLAAIRQPNGISCAITTEGSRIREIERPDASPPVLKADYDACGRPLTVTIAGNPPHRFEWSGDSLVAWQRPDGSRVDFSYSNRLLTGIAGPGSEHSDLAWSPIPGWVSAGWGSAERFWNAPVRLRSLNNLEFSYDITPKGAVYRTTDRGGGTVTTTLLNWREEKLTQSSPSGTLLVLYDSRVSPPGYFTEIDDGGGRPLERYLYNSRRRLTGVERDGGAEIPVVRDAAGSIAGWDGRLQDGLPIGGN